MFQKWQMKEFKRAIKPNVLFDTLPITAWDTSQNLAYVIGAVMGDGHINKRGEINLVVIDKGFANTFKIALKSWIKKNPKSFIRLPHKFISPLNKKMYFPTKKLFGIRVFSRDGVRLLTKHIQNLDYLPLEMYVGTLKGLFDSEGSVCPNGINFYNKNLKLIFFVKRALKRLRIETTYIYKANNGVYILSINKLKSRRLFEHLIGFRIKRKQLKLEEINN